MSEHLLVPPGVTLTIEPEDMVMKKVHRIPFKWETLYPENDMDHGNAYLQTDRAKVIGGWLIREMVSIDSNEHVDDWKNVNSNITFIPDPDHQWEV